MHTYSTVTGALLDGCDGTCTIMADGRHITPLVVTSVLAPHQQEAADRQAAIHAEREVKFAEQDVRLVRRAAIARVRAANAAIMADLKGLPW